MKSYDSYVRELDEGWMTLEERMKQAYPDTRSLSRLIQDFPLSYGLDPERFRQVLRIRDAVVHNTRDVKRAELRKTVEDLDNLIKLTPGE